MSSARDLIGRFISNANAEFAETGMVWTPVSSSNVAEVGYDDQNQTLGVRFLSGSEYEYYGVDKDTYAQLRDAGSVGKFLNFAIKGRFAYERVS